MERSYFAVEFYLAVLVYDHFFFYLHVFNFLLIFLDKHWSYFNFFALMSLTTVNSLSGYPHSPLPSL